jgi:hypothetical protein
VIAATAPACRLAIKLATEAPVAVVLRRGPSRWAQLIRWRLDDDSVELGQWVRARIYEDMCDLSADGELFVYCARRNTKATLRALGEATWTAVSRPPYFTALALWSHSGYCGGGLFTGARRLALALPMSLTRLQGRLAPGLTVEALGQLGPAAGQMEKSGWRPVGDWPTWNWPYQRPKQGPAWQKQSANDAVRVVMQPHRRNRRKGVDARTAKVYQVVTAWRTHDIGEVEFLELDTRGRLLMGRNAGLWVCDAPLADRLAWRQVADLSACLPDPAPSPAWAREWPRTN